MTLSLAPASFCSNALSEEAATRTFLPRLLLNECAGPAALFAAVLAPTGKAAWRRVDGLPALGPAPCTLLARNSLIRSDKLSLNGRPFYPSLLSSSAICPSPNFAETGHCLREKS